MRQGDGRPGFSLRGALAGIGRCQLLSLAALAVSGAGALVIGALLLLPIGIGFLLLPPAAAALRRISDRYRDWAARWTGTVISPPQPLPSRQAPPENSTGRHRQARALLGDDGFWHDLRWAWAEPWTGALLAAVPLALVDTASSARPYSPSSGGSWATATGTPSSSSTPPRRCSPRSCSASDSSPRDSGWPPPPCDSTHTGADACSPPRTPPNSSAASNTSQVPVPTSSTSRPPNCAASSGTCTTGHRPASSPSA
ncbi:sensor domain-containing protein [Streptomyces sp. NPDC001584]|uniref:sensor domain-containing protein n=1 Tax=Streptomyces sp. NPDC001584 TaxID=3154521 RepID=UPI003329AABD